MTNLQREENAAILRSHLQMKPEFAPHTGEFISDLCDLVIERVDDLCEFCFGTGEYVSRGYMSDETTVERCDCPAGKALK